jgi:hypothetical protein
VAFFVSHRLQESRVTARIASVTKVRHQLALYDGRPLGFQQVILAHGDDNIDHFDFPLP